MENNIERNFSKMLSEICQQIAEESMPSGDNDTPKVDAIEGEASEEEINEVLKAMGLYN